MENLFLCCCFTGNRPSKLPWGYNEKDKRCDAMKKDLVEAIEQAISNGYDTFLCGMALGFDMICAETVLKLKHKYPHIKLIGVVPCKNQSEQWSKEKKQRYNNILSQLNYIRCKYEYYVYGCMQERNRFMVDNSSLVIAYSSGIAGGTLQTIDYANKQNKKVINLYK